MEEQVFGRDWDEKVAPVCPRCGYDLRGLSDQRCPECGYAPTFAELRSAARETSVTLVQLKDVHLTLKGGTYAVILGFGGFGLLRLGSLGGLGMLVGVFCGLAAVGCGLQVFRVWRLPAHAIQFLAVEPDYTKAALVAILGGVLMALSVWAP